MHARNEFLLASFLFLNPIVHHQPVPATRASENSAATQAHASPQIFEPGVISGPANDGSPTLTPDGKTIFFTRAGATWSIIVESHRTGDHWSEPQIAPFSGGWVDLHPALSADGSYLVFVSLRPAAPNAARGIPTTSATPGGVASLWRVNRANHGWSEPVRLPETVNFCPRIFKPSLAADGSVYFMAQLEGQKFRLFRSQYASGTYAKAEPLPFSDGVTNDVDPEVARDESFLLFSSDGRRSGDASHEHLYIAYNKDGAWSEVVPVHDSGDDTAEPSNENDAHLSADQRALYFSSDRTMSVQFPRTREQAKEDLERLRSWDNGNFNVWFMPLAPLLNAEKIEQKAGSKIK